MKSVTFLRNDNPDDAGSGAVSHLDAAVAHFAAEAQGDTKPAPDKPAPDKPAPDKPAPDKPAPDKPAEGSNFLKDLVKIPGTDKPEGDAATDEPAIEDVAKGLHEPRPDTKSYAGWQELKKRANEDRAARVAAERERDALKAAKPVAVADEATKARVAELETQLKTYSERLKTLDAKSHPEFESKYVAPMNAAKSKLAEIAKNDEVEINVEELLSLKGRAFNAAVSETMDKMSSYARVKFQAALEGYIAADLGAQDALKNADGFLAGARQNGAARAREAFDRVSGSYANAFLPAAVDDKTDPTIKDQELAYNEAIAATRTNAEKYAFGDLNETSAADLANKAALYDFTIQHGLPRIGRIFTSKLAAADAKIATLEKQLAAVTAAKPGVSGGAGPGGAEGDTPASEMSHLDAARKYNWGGKPA